MWGAKEREENVSKALVLSKWKMALPSTEMGKAMGGTGLVVRV